MGSPYILPISEDLLEEEVDFDLKLRGQTVDRRETFDDKKRFLRRLMMDERKSKTVCKGTHRFKDEVFTIEKNVKEIVEGLEKRRDRALVSRLRHYLIRAYTAVTKDDSEKDSQTTLCNQIERILSECGQKVREEAGVEDSEKETEESEQDEEKEESEQDEKKKDDEEKDKKEVERRKFEAEWQEFQLWKSKQKDSKMDETEEDSSSYEDERPPKSNKSRKSRKDHGTKVKKEVRRDKERPRKSTKSRRSKMCSDESETGEQ